MAMRPATTQAGFCRLTVLAPRGRVDVSLPADVPVAELVPMVLELVGEPVFGLRPVAWVLSGAAGGTLPPAATLAELAVPDGELLRLAPAAPPPPPPVFDDPVEALAATAGGGVRDRRFAAGAVRAVAVAAAALLAIGRGGIVPAAVAAVAAVIAVLVAAWLARRAVAAPPPDGGAGSPDGSAPDTGPTGRADDPALLHMAGHTAAVTAVPLAAAAGWAALPGTSAATGLLLAAAAAATVATLAQVGLRVVAPLLIGTVVAAVPVGLAALTVLRTDLQVPSVAAAACAVTLAAGPILPRAALRLAGMPRPVVPGDGSELVDADAGPDMLPPEEFAERADLARGYLAGLVGGCGAVAAGAAILAADGGGWAGPVLAAVATAVLALRARSYADPGPTNALLTCTVAACVGFAGLVALRADVDGQAIAAAALLVIALVGVGALTRDQRSGSPVVRRAVDLLEGLLIAAAIPLALAAMGLFQLVRQL